MELDAADSPSIPVRSHRNSQRRSLHASRRQSTGPDVISNLISSLSVISQPATSHFEGHPVASPSQTYPTSPSQSPNPGKSAGSFGVDYGAFSKSSTFDDYYSPDPTSLDEIAASPPVVRQSSSSKNRKGQHSSQTRSPRSTSRDSSSNIRSFFRGGASPSRPSSRGSVGSRNDDTRSIGNLSVERGSAPTPELRTRRSLDSWGKKATRGSKNLMYMSSKEQLRERDYDRNEQHNRGDPFLAETTISEEPTLYAADSPQKIPTRDSSLRKKRNSKRSSARRSTRDGDSGSVHGAILEAAEEYTRSAMTSRMSHRRSTSDNAKHKLFDVDEYDPANRGRGGLALSDIGDEIERQRAYAEDIDEEGAPSPAISSGRRRWERSQDRSSSRLSGRLSPNPPDGLNPKRSSSRLKRLSGGLGSRSETRGRDSSSERRNLPAGYERPVSPDSIDDAVESYLCSPRLSQKIKHPQTGRVISFSEVGDPEGSAVFCCVGMGLTRYITAFYDELALTLRLRLITPDRPGVGDSGPHTDNSGTPLTWPDDVYTICQVLKITKFSILAHSAGAIYALATALRMPQHIRGKIHLLAPWIPPSQMSVFGSAQTVPPSNAIPTSQRILRALPTPILKAANSSFMSATSSSLTSSLPKTPRRKTRKVSGQNKNGGAATLDKENLDMPTLSKNLYGGDGGVLAMDAPENMDRMQPPQGTLNADCGIAATGDPEIDKERQATYDTRLTYAIWELATTGANPAVDLLVCLERRHTIGFRYVDITRPVVIHHGSKDTRVPVDNIKWLGKAMRRCEVRVLEEEGHGLMASAAVMGSVLMEMSKEWEDWMRVTGADGRKDRERGRKGVMVR